jgi:hypothetical protein
MGEHISLLDQIDELELIWEARNKDYDEAVARGHMRLDRANIRQNRLAATIRIMMWLSENALFLKSYIAHMKSLNITSDPDEEADQAAVDEITHSEAAE